MQVSFLNEMAYFCFLLRNNYKITLYNYFRDLLETASNQILLTVGKNYLKTLNKNAFGLKL